MSGAMYATTTEVYPDSPKASGEICNKTQVRQAKSANGFSLVQLFRSSYDRRASGLVENHLAGL
jgi:hypothetical protein